MLIWLLVNVNSTRFAFINFVIENRFLRRSASILGKIMFPKAKMGIIIVNDKPSTFLNSLSFTVDAAKSLQSCPILCNPMDQSPSGSSVHGILRQKYWTGLLHPPPEDLPNPGIKPASLMFPTLAGGYFTTSTIWESPGEGNGYPLWYSCLENSMDRGAWWVTGVTKESDIPEWLTLYHGCRDPNTF